MYDVCLLSFVVQDRISSADRAVNFRWQITTDIGPLREADITSLDIQDWLQMPVIQSSDVICKNEDGSDITQDVDVLFWWRDVGQARFPHIAVMTRQFLSISESSATTERVFSFAGLTLSDLLKSLLEGTLETIMWTKWGSPSIPFGRGDLHITHLELCD